MRPTVPVDVEVQPVSTRPMGEVGRDQRDEHTRHGTGQGLALFRWSSRPPPVAQYSLSGPHGASFGLESVRQLRSPARSGPAQRMHRDDEGDGHGDEGKSID